MKLRIQTLTGQTGEVEADPKDSILDLKVQICIMHEIERNWTERAAPLDPPM